MRTWDSSGCTLIDWHLAATSLAAATTTSSLANRPARTDRSTARDTVAQKLAKLMLSRLSSILLLSGSLHRLSSPILAPRRCHVPPIMPLLLLLCLQAMDPIPYHLSLLHLIS